MTNKKQPVEISQDFAGIQWFQFTNTGQRYVIPSTQHVISTWLNVPLDGVWEVVTDSNGCPHHHVVTIFNTTGDVLVQREMPC